MTYIKRILSVGLIGLTALALGACETTSNDSGSAPSETVEPAAEIDTLSGDAVRDLLIGNMVAGSGIIGSHRARYSFWECFREDSQMVGFWKHGETQSTGDYDGAYAIADDGTVTSNIDSENEWRFKIRHDGENEYEVVDERQDTDDAIKITSGCNLPKEG